MISVIQLSIADIERETGISQDVLRVWERRYGFPLPQRNQRGERVYTVEQLDRLCLIKQLLGRGMRPGKLAMLDDHQLKKLTLLPEDADVVPDSVAALMAILINGSNNELLSGLEALLRQQGIMSFLTDVVAPMNRAVGKAWFAGRIGVFEEHQYAEQLRTVLTNAISSMPQGTESPRVLLTTLPGEQHGIGLLMVACVLRHLGAGTVLLGVQTPLNEIVRGVVERNCSIVGISSSEHMSHRVIAAQLVRLRKLLPDTVSLWVGGSGVHSISLLNAKIRLFHDLNQISHEIKQGGNRII